MVPVFLGCEGQLRQVDDPKAGGLPEKAPEGWRGLVSRTREQCNTIFTAIIYQCW
jgi:hypothetical protein